MKLSEKISPIMQELEWLFLENAEVKQDYDLQTFRAGIYIFQSLLMDKLFDRQLREGMTIENAGKEAEFAGNELRAFVLKYTGIDTMELFK